jgi:hypothetical protein
MSFDLHIEGVPLSLVSGTRGLTFGDYPVHVGVRGIQKLVDRFLKCFLTPLGSDMSDKDYGTQLAASFGVGNIDSVSIRQLVSLAVQQVEDTLRRYETEYATDTDERIASAQIQQLIPTADNDGFDVYVLISNVAGTTVLLRVQDITRI